MAALRGWPLRNMTSYRVAKPCQHAQAVTCRRLQVVLPHLWTIYVHSKIIDFYTYEGRYSWMTKVSASHSHELLSFCKTGMALQNRPCEPLVRRSLGIAEQKSSHEGLMGQVVIIPSDEARPAPLRVRDCGKHILPCWAADALPFCCKKPRTLTLGKARGHLHRR